MPSKPLFAVLMMGLVLSLCVVPTATADEDELTDEAVREGIRKAVGYLYDKQKEWGHWEGAAKRPEKGGGNHSKQWGGKSSLAAYALLSAGEEWQDNPKLLGALKFLAQTETDGTYAVGLRAHVWPKLPNASAQINFFDELREDASLLVTGINTKGAYHYVLGASSWDNSCTQYGGLGVWEAAKRGLPIREEYWRSIEDHFMETQNSANGGWGYGGKGTARMTMTAAGLAMLYITLDYLHAGDFRRVGVTPKHPVIQRINKGLEYFDENYEPSGDGYLMVGVERVALASGRKFFNDKDWYRSGAAKFLGAQREHGGIGGGRGAVVQTSFGLVFLSRGRAPVFANKLEVPESHWNNRPRDLAHLTKWASDQFEQDMNWQVISVERPATDWMDAPILYIASHRSLDLTDEQWEKLKRFVDLGGLIVTTADDSSGAFTRSVTRGFEQLYPYSFTRVDDDDPLLDIVYPLDRSNVRSLHNGVRHLVLHIPYDVSGMFQLKNTENEEPWHLMANAFQYAIGKSGTPTPRLERHYIEKERRASRSVRVGRVEHGGNWNPEPGAWPQLDIFATNASRVGFDPYALPMEDLGGAGMAMAHIAGVGATEFTDEQARALRKYVFNGGVACLETVAGDADFQASLGELLKKAFPGKRLRMLPANHPIITGEGLDGGFDNSSVDFRRFYKQRLGDLIVSRPQLMAIEIDGEIRVVVAYDGLSSGMAGVKSWGIFGYDIPSARRIMTNIALYAENAGATD